MFITELKHVEDPLKKYILDQDLLINYIRHKTFSEIYECVIQIGSQFTPIRDGGISFEDFCSVIKGQIGFCDSSSDYEMYFDYLITNFS